MNKDEAVSILESYRFYQRKAQQITYKIKQLRRDITFGGGGLSTEEKVSGGSPLSREEKFAKLFDLEDEYLTYLKQAEEGCNLANKLILNIYTNNTLKVTLSKKDLSRLKKSEEILTLRYINNFSQLEVANELCYDTRWVRELLFRAIEDFSTYNSNYSYQKYLDELNITPIYSD